MSSSESVIVGFDKPRGCAAEKPTMHLYVANCGWATGLSMNAIEKAFASFGPLSGIREADDSGTRVVVSFVTVDDAVAAKEAWSGRHCHLLQGRIMYMQYAVPRQYRPVEDPPLVMTVSEELAIPGLAMYLDFVSEKEEQELMASVDPLPWQTLAKRRVQHFGYEFLYKTRNVDLSQKLGNLPTFVEQVVEKISALGELMQGAEPSLPLDQLTVNEYPRGIGLSPHIDTHSAFEGSIISLSLAGPCVMEFRRYPRESDESGAGSYGALAEVSSEQGTMERKSLFLPQRSLLVLSGEARYAWHHYIPHRKVDCVNGEAISRGSRRVSFTFRKVRSGPCQCTFVKDCDSQASDLSVSSPCLLDTEKVQASGEGNTVCPPESEDKFSGIDKSQLGVLNNKLVPAEIKDVGGKVAGLLIPSKGASQPPNSQAGGMTFSKTEHNASQQEFSSERVSFSTPEIEKLYVHRVYDAIAPHFSATRFAKWPKVALFLDSLAPGSLVADSGCGNGKYLGFNPKCFFIGCDISPPLVAICAHRGHEALVADALHLPYRTGFHDAAISIAVLHHLSNDQRRRRAIEELVRVVCPGGKVLITVWAREQEDHALVKKWTPLSDKYVEEWVSDKDSLLTPRQGLLSSLEIIQEAEGPVDSNFDKDQRLSENIDLKEDGTLRINNVEGQLGSKADRMRNKAEHQQEYFVPWHLPYHRAEVSGASAAAVASGFARKDEKKGAVVYDRYYHVFAEGELERIAGGVQGAAIIDRFYDKSNWCIILQKFS